MSHMAKKGLIIVNAYEVFPSVLHLVERLEEEFSLFGVSLITKSSLDAMAIVGGDKESLPFDFVIFLDKDIYVAHSLERQGFRLFNSAKAIWSTDDKMKTHLLLEGSGIRMPKTLSAPLRYSQRENPDFLKKVMRKLAFPIVAKENYGSQGKGVFLAKNEQELRDLEKRLAFTPHLYQQFIESSKGKDFRIIVIGHRAVAWMERESQNGDFRSNIALGGMGKKTDLPKEFLETAEKASSLLGLDYCGVDLLYGEKGEPILCEVNSNAHIKNLMNATGKDVSDDILEHIIGLIG